MSRLTALALSAAVVFFANGALAESNEDNLRQILPEIQSALMQQDIVKTLRTYNKARQDMTQADIDGLEAIWHSELNSGYQPLITGVVRNMTVLRMRKVIRDTGGVISEINVIDARGVSIAQTTTFPHIWQGTTEEAKDIAAADPNMVLISKVETDVSDRPRQLEVFSPVIDPDTNELIGAVILVVEAESF